MPTVIQRELSAGELTNRNRKRYKKKPVKLTKKQLRRQQSRHQKHTPWQGSNQLISDTARAWGLSYKDIHLLFSWVEDKIPRDRRSVVLATLLRRKYKGISVKRPLVDVD